MKTGTFYFDIDGRQEEVFLGPTEAAIMQLAWTNSTLTVKKALVLLGSDASLAYTTVMTVMNRLVDKRLLLRTREGKYFVYRAAAARQEFLRDRLRAVADCLTKNFPEQSRGLLP